MQSMVVRASSSPEPIEQDHGFRPQLLTLVTFYCFFLKAIQVLNLAMPPSFRGNCGASPNTTAQYGRSRPPLDRLQRTQVRQTP